MADIKKLFPEVEAEHNYAMEKWGGDNVDDEMNSPIQWMAYLQHYSSRWYPGHFPPFSEAELADFRRDMIKVANLALSAAEQVDRKN